MDKVTRAALGGLGMVALVVSYAIIVLVLSIGVRDFWSFTFFQIPALVLAVFVCFSGSHALIAALRGRQ